MYSANSCIGTTFSTIGHFFYWVHVATWLLSPKAAQQDLPYFFFLLNCLHIMNLDLQTVHAYMNTIQDASNHWLIDDFCIMYFIFPYSISTRHLRVLLSWNSYMAGQIFLFMLVYTPHISWHRLTHFSALPDYYILYHSYSGLSQYTLVYFLSPSKNRSVSCLVEDWTGFHFIRIPIHPLKRHQIQISKNNRERLLFITIDADYE